MGYLMPEFVYMIIMAKLILTRCLFVLEGPFGYSVCLCTLVVRGQSHVSLCVCVYVVIASVVDIDLTLTFNTLQCWIWSLNDSGGGINS